MKFTIFFAFLVVASAENFAASYKPTQDAKKPGYSFDSSYDNNSRSESRHGKVTTGSYRVPLPDGRFQVVNYRADENGYVADVKYEGEAKYPEYKPASSYSAPAYKAESVPVYEVVTTAKPTYKIPTTPAPTTTSPAYKAPAYVEPRYIAPAPTAAPTYEDRSYPDPEYKALYKIATTTPAPTTTTPRAYVAPADVEYKVPAYSAPAHQTPVSPAYGIRYIGDVKQYEHSYNYLETKVNSSPAYKSTFFVIPKYKVSSLVAPVYETPEVPDYRTFFYPAPAAPLPLAYRARYAAKTANKVVDQSRDYMESPYVAPKVTSVYTPVYSARTTTTPAYQDLPTAAPAYNVPITTTAAPVYSTSSYKVPEYETSTSAPAYKPTTFFTSNKDSISTGYKELSRIFRETSLTAGNKNWDNFFNKAWEFARTKY